MLEKLSSGLKDALRKLAGKSYIDKAVLDELSKDIEKALLSGDVDVKIAKELTAKIRERAEKEKPPAGSTAREHIVKIVYEELVKFVGEKSEIPLRPTKILLAGLFGSGKCVHPESLISLADGHVLTAEHLYKELSIGATKEIDKDAEIYDVSDKNILIHSFNPNTLKLENKRLTHLWKLDGKELLEVFLDNGNDFSVKITPEHPFFLLRDGRVQQIRADELNEDDFIAVPRSYDTNCGVVDLLPQLKILDLEVKMENKICFKMPIKELHKNLPYKKNYCVLTRKLKHNMVPISLIEDSSPSIPVKFRQSVKYISFPRYLTEELAEFLGYVWGDGHIDPQYVEIVNEDPEIIERVKILGKTLFNLEVKAERDLRTRKMYRLKLFSVTLVNILNKVFGIPIGKKGKNLAIPSQIFASDLDTTRKFLKAYFDCDSYAAADHREIELVTESKSAAMGIKFLLLRFCIVSALSRKVINGINYWRLRISARYAEFYADKIGFVVKHKDERAKTYKSIGLLQGCGKQDMIPLGRALQDARFSFGFSIGEIQKHVNSYGMYETKGLISRESLFKLCKLYREVKVGFIANILYSLSRSENIRSKFSVAVINGSLQHLIRYGFVEKDGNVISLTQKGKTLLERSDQFEKLAYLESLANSNVCWLQVAKIEKCAAPEYVYDFTVEDNHSFIADGIIVHNTTTASKLAKFYQKRGLRPALIACDVTRPAAYEQLQQLAEQLHVPFYGEKGNKIASEIAKNGMQKVKADIYIFDSSGRNALDKEMIAEIRAINDIAKPQEKILVIPADIGQAARAQAKGFQDALGITGVIITKMDGTAKAGGALTACAMTGAQVKWIGVGEKVDALERFDPDRFVSKLIGWGDIQGLVEKAKEAIEPEKAEKMAEKLMEGKFTLADFLEQIKAMQKMGSLSSILGNIPGMGGMKLPAGMDLGKQEDKMKRWKFAIESMTIKEREEPSLLDASRIKRISKGSGVPESEIRELIKQYEQSKKMMKSFGGGAMRRGPLAKLAKKFGGR